MRRLEFHFIVSYCSAWTSLFLSLKRLEFHFIVSMIASYCLTLTSLFLSLKTHDIKFILFELLLFLVITIVISQRIYDSELVLIYFPGEGFPEEVVAELNCLRERLTYENKSVLQIRCILFYEVLRLIWAFYIQIKIENLWLPPIDQKIDD